MYHSRSLSQQLSGIRGDFMLDAKMQLKESVPMLKWIRCGLETPLNDRLFLFSPYVRDLPLRFREATFCRGSD